MSGPILLRRGFQVTLIGWLLAQCVAPLMKITGTVPPHWADRITDVATIIGALLTLVGSEAVPFLYRWFATSKKKLAPYVPVVAWNHELPKAAEISEISVVNGAWGRSWNLWETRMKYIQRNSFNRASGDQAIELDLHQRTYPNFQAFYQDEAAHELRPMPALAGNLTTALAVVGPAGIGKSYQMLRLLRERMQLVGEECGDYQGLIPVLLDLATWETGLIYDPNFEFEIWAHRALCEAYELKTEAARWLINAHRLLFFLDGLDEVAPAEQSHCFAAIRDYVERHRNVVVTCRPDQLKELLAAAPDLARWPPRFPVAVLQTVDADTMARTIRRSIADAALAEKAVAAVARYRLGEYVETPLLLNLFVQVYNPDTDQLLAESYAAGHTEFTNLLWGKYETLRSNTPRITPKIWAAVRVTLIWTARKMPLNTLSLEDIQPHHWLHDTPPLLWRSAAPVPAVPEATSAAVPAPAEAAAPAEPGEPGEQAAPAPVGPAQRTATGHRLSAPLLLYYFTSRLLTALLLAVAVGAVIAEPGDFLAEGVLVGLGAAAFTVGVGYYPWLQGKAAAFERFLGRLVSPSLTLAVSFAGLLMLVCAVYEGFTVKRAARDMAGAFSITQSTLGILVGLMAGIVFGFRKYDQRGLDDIRPLERVGFRWRDALRMGTRGGIGAGLLIGILGVLLDSCLPNATLDTWLKTYFGAAPPPGGAVSRAGQVFLLAFVVAGLVGFGLLGLLASLDTSRSMLDPDEKARQARRQVSTGIAHSLRNGLKNAGWVLVGAGCWYGAVFGYQGEFQPERLFRILLIGLGGSLIAFIWFGGFEVIQHWTLRFYLFVYGRLPFNFGQHLRVAQRLAFFKQSGYLTSFAHESLLQYYAQPSTARYAPAPPADRSQAGVLRGVVLGLGLGTVGLLAAPLWHRYLGAAYPYFWHRPNELALRVAPTAGQVLGPAQSGGATVLRLRQTGHLRVHFAGLVHLGTFVGHSSVAGREYGFMGFAIKNAYDVHPQFAHGAVLYQQLPDTTWYALVAQASRIPGGPGTAGAAALRHPVRPGAEVRFVVNDREWENNSGHFSLHCQVVPTAKKSARSMASPPSVLAARHR